MNLLEPIQTPVNGDDYACDQGNSRQALAQFYRALNSRDLNLMEQNWDNSAAAAMDNPLGGIKRGWKEIQTVYERLFETTGAYQFEFYDYTLHESGNLFYAVGRERGELALNGMPLRVAIRTTRIFQKDMNGKWRQVHHHGSIDNPEMLAAYQKAVLGAKSGT